jgi:hypothetical protein
VQIYPKIYPINPNVYTVGVFVIKTVNRSFRDAKSNNDVHFAFGVTANGTNLLQKLPRRHKFPHCLRFRPNKFCQAFSGMLNRVLSVDIQFVVGLL